MVNLFVSSKPLLLWGLCAGTLAVFVADGIPLMRERVFSRLPLIGRLQRYQMYATIQENNKKVTEEETESTQSQ